MSTTAAVILASSSPRRVQLLRADGIAFDVVPPRLEEPPCHDPDIAAPQLAEALAYFKARIVAEQHPTDVVLGADTVVADDDGHVLGKPTDTAEARRMLETLSGSRHAVITGVALLGPGPRRLIASDTTHVTMRRMTDDEIQAYLDSGEWQGKAGAYAIQETADRFVTSVEGSFTNVVGLPMELVRRMLGMRLGDG